MTPETPELFVTPSGFLATWSEFLVTPSGCMLTFIRSFGVTNTNDASVVMKRAIMLREGQDYLNRCERDALCEIITYNPI